MPSQAPDLELYRDTYTNEVYVRAPIASCGVQLQDLDLDSEPGDPEGVMTIGEWEFWRARSKGRIVRVYVENEDF